MNRAVLLVLYALVTVLLVMWFAIEAPGIHSLDNGAQSVRVSRCFQDSRLSESVATLKLQGGPAVTKVYESLLNKARTTPGCRTEIVQALIRSLEQATEPAANHFENYFLWQHGSGLLADLKATEALDLLIANINLTDGLSTSLSHCPALVAILKIGEPAIPKLEIALAKDPVSYRRSFEVLAIAYIGGAEAKKALTRALSRETDPCVKNFLVVSRQAFDNRVRPNHISSELNGKWLSAFYCQNP
jgi:hypothetical protein